MVTTYVSGGGSDTVGLELVFWAVVGIATLVGYVFILRKAGWSGWLVLLGLIPFVNIAMFFVFAFAEWPIQRELRETRRAYALYAQAQRRAEVGPR